MPRRPSSELVHSLAQHQRLGERLAKYLAKSLPPAPRARGPGASETALERIKRKLRSKSHDERELGADQLAQEVADEGLTVEQTARLAFEAAKDPSRQVAKFIMRWASIARDVGSPHATPVLARLINHAQISLRGQIPTALNLSSPSDRLLWRHALYDPNKVVREIAATHVPESNEPFPTDVFVELAKRLNDPSGPVRNTAASNLDNRYHPAIRHDLIRALKSPDHYVRQVAASSLWQAPGTDLHEPFMQLRKREQSTRKTQKNRGRSDAVAIRAAIGLALSGHAGGLPDMLNTHEYTLYENEIPHVMNAFHTLANTSYPVGLTRPDLHAALRAVTRFWPKRVEQWPSDAIELLPSLINAERNKPGKTFRTKSQFDLTVRQLRDAQHYERVK